jgi:hypothetical protein
LQISDPIVPSPNLPDSAFLNESFVPIASCDFPQSFDFSASDTVAGSDLIRPSDFQETDPIIPSNLQETRPLLPSDLQVPGTAAFSPSPTFVPSRYFVATAPLQSTNRQAASQGTVAAIAGVAAVVVVVIGVVIAVIVCKRSDGEETGSSVDEIAMPTETTPGCVEGTTAWESGVPITMVSPLTIATMVVPTEQE